MTTAITADNLALHMLAAQQQSAALSAAAAVNKDFASSKDLVKYVVGLFDRNSSGYNRQLPPLGSPRTPPLENTMTSVKDEPIDIVTDNSDSPTNITYNDSPNNHPDQHTLNHMFAANNAYNKLLNNMKIPSHISTTNTSSESMETGPKSPSKRPAPAIAGHGLKRIFDEPSQDVVKYVMGKRGGCQIVWQGHRYTRDRTRNDQTYWACVLKRPPYRCKGRISTKSSFVTSATAHNHDQQTAKSQTARLVHQIKQFVQESDGDIEPTYIVMNCLQAFKFNENGNEELPAFDTLVKMCKRIIKTKKKIEDEGSLSMTSTSSPNYTTSAFKSPTSNNNHNLLDTTQYTGQFPNLPKNIRLPQLTFKPNTCSTANSSETTISTTSTFLSSTHPFASAPIFTNNQFLVKPPSMMFNNQNMSLPRMSLDSTIPGLREPHNTHDPSNTTPTSATNSPNGLNLRMSEPVSLSDELMEDSDDMMEIEGRQESESMLRRGVSSIQQLRSNLDDLECLYRARVSEIKLIENELEGCKNDKSTKEELIKSLQTEVSKLDVALKVAQEGLQKARTTSEDKVERSLMKSFFTQYLIAPDNRKAEVLRLMTSILKFTDEELSSLKKQKDSKWLSNLFTPVGGAPTDVATGESFSELFISFLETEANRGSIIGSRAVSTPPIIRPSHKRNLSTTSNKSAVSVSSTAESEPTLSSFNIGSSPVVVPQSLADLLGKKPR